MSNRGAQGHASSETGSRAPNNVTGTPPSVFPLGEIHSQAGPTCPSRLSDLAAQGECFFPKLPLKPWNRSL